MSKWTAEEKKVIRRFAGQLQARQIAELLPGRTEYGVQHQAKAMRISLKAFGAFHHCARYREEQRNTVIHMRKQGLNYPQMVAQTGMPKSAIQYILNTYRGSK